MNGYEMTMSEEGTTEPFETLPYDYYLAHTYRFDMSQNLRVDTFMKFTFCLKFNCTLVIKKDDPAEPPNVHFPLHVILDPNSRGCPSIPVDLRSSAVAIPQHGKLPESRYFLTNILSFLALFITIVFATRVYAKLSRVDCTYFGTLEILQCLLGSRLAFGGDRIFYISLISLSIFIGNALVDLATEFTTEERRIEVRNLEVEPTKRSDLFHLHC